MDQNIKFKLKRNVYIFGCSSEIIKSKQIFYLARWYDDMSRSQEIN